VVAYGTNLRRVEEEASRKIGKPKEDIAVEFVESIRAIF
jgi:hypothetical protein